MKPLEDLCWKVAWSDLSLTRNALATAVRITCRGRVEEEWESLGGYCVYWSKNVSDYAVHMLENVWLLDIFLKSRQWDLLVDQLRALFPELYSCFDLCVCVCVCVCMCVCACMLNCLWFFATIWTLAPQAPLSMGFFGQGYWSGFAILFFLQKIFLTQESKRWLPHCRKILCLLSPSLMRCGPSFLSPTAIHQTN